MEYIEIFEKVGLPGLALIGVLLGGRVLWEFFTDTYWPHYREMKAKEEEHQQREMEREADQITWLVEKLGDVSHNLLRVMERMDRLEIACREKQFKDAYETQPIPREVTEALKASKEKA